MSLTRRGKCRCGKILTFRYGPDGLKKRCSRCGSVVRLRLTASEKPADVHATEKKLPVWTYAPTEEMAAMPASSSSVEWSSSEGPAMPPPLPKMAGTQDRAVLDAVAEAEWVAIEEVLNEHRQRRSSVLIASALIGGLLVLGAAAFFFFRS
jgi:hypothetical protein